MQRVNSLLSAGVTLTSTGTAVSSPIPRDSSGYWPAFVRVVASGAGCYVKVGNVGVTAVAGDCMIQPLDGEILYVKGCKAISALTVSGTSSITVVPLERGSWSYDLRSLDYTFTSLTSLPSTITFARADATTCATYFNASGVLSTAAANVPRFDYDPVTLLPKGLLIEESRVNNEGNTVAYSKGVAGDTVVQNAVAPDGTTTAYTITGDGTSGTHYAAQVSVTPTATNTYTISVHLKAGTSSLVQVCTGLAHSGATVYCNYNLSTQAMTAGAGIVSGSNFITNVGGGWYRVGFSYVASATTGAQAIITYAIAAISDTRGPTNTANTSYLRWGGQYESTATMGSAAFATSYIPTTTTAVTRTSDSASMTGTNFSSWFNQSAGTFIVEYLREPSQTSYTVQGVTVSDGTLNNRLQMQLNGTGLANNIYRSGGVNSDIAPPATVATALGGVGKVCSAYDGTGSTVVSNGGPEVTGAGSLPVGVNIMYIGSNAGGAVTGVNHIRRIQYYATRLPLATRQSLTA